MPQPLSDAGYHSLARFRHALRRFQRFSENAARQAGLTPAQHQLILAIRGFAGPGSPSVSDMAEQLQLKLHSTVELVARAAAKDLVEQWTDPGDGRRQLLALTSLGEEKLAALSAQNRAELRRFKNQMNDVLLELDD